MSSRYCDIQYGLFLFEAKTPSKDNFRKDTGSILKMLPYFHLQSLDNIYSNPTFTALEITGQEPPTIDNIDIKLIVDVYNKRRNLGWKTCIVLSYLTENTLFRDQLYLLISLVNNGINPRDIVVFFPDGNYTNDHMIDINGIINSLNCRIIPVIHSELHAYYRTQISFEQDTSEYSAHRPKKILLPLGKLFKDFRLQLAHEIYNSKRDQEFIFSIWQSKENIINYFQELDRWQPNNTNSNGFDFLGRVDLNHFPNFPAMVKNKEFQNFCISRQGSVENFNDSRLDSTILKLVNENSAHLGYPFSKKIYDESIMSIVAETFFKLDFVTEKFFKPIINSHPFILFSEELFTDFIKKLGYVTFEDVIGEQIPADLIPEMKIKKKLEKTLVILDNYHSLEAKIVEKVNYNKQVFQNRATSKFKEILATFLEINNS